MNHSQIIFENTPDVLMLVAVEEDGARFRYVEANRATESLSGLPLAEVVGATPEQLLPADQAKRLSDQYRRCYTSGQATEIELVLATPSGQHTWQVHINPYRPESDITHLIVSARDVTKTRDVSQLLNSLEGHLPGFVYQISYSSDGTWRYTFASANSLSMFGIPSDQIMADAKALLGRIHPDDVDWVFAETLDAMTTLKPWHAEFRMIHMDGSVIWLSAQDIPQKLADGTVVCTGYTNDITDKKLLEESLRQSEAKFRQLVENANDIISTVERDGTISYVSPNWKATLGHELAEVTGCDVCDYIHPDEVEACREMLAELFATGQAIGGVESRVRHKNGDWLWYVANVTPLFDSQGNLVNFMVIARNVTRQKAMEQAIRQLAEVDSVTGLSNRLAFMSRLQMVLEQNTASAQNFALLYMDLDGFKQVNDTYGHAAGDKLLQVVGQKITDTLRNSDQVGRIGGDEFMVLLPGPIDSRVALAIGQRICRLLAEPITVDGHDFAVAASIGVALFPDNGRDVESLSRAADFAMYRAKAQGGSRAALAQTARELLTVP